MNIVNKLWEYDVIQNSTYGSTAHIINTRIRTIRAEYEFQIRNATASSKLRKHQEYDSTTEQRISFH